MKYDCSVKPDFTLTRCKVFKVCIMQQVCLFITSASLAMLGVSLLIALLVASVHCASRSYLHPNARVHNFTQRIDHFSYGLKDATFSQRVIIYDGEWRRNGDPIFFYAGNEDDIFMFANFTGFPWEYASNFSAMVVFAEHRYYGQSMPFGEDSLKSLDKYAYLSVSQAMGDFAANIVTIKSLYNASDSPVIVFGGSYGGMLAAYMRNKYPHLVDGAVASSAPIWTTIDDYNCTSFNEIVTSDFAAYSDACVVGVRKSWSAMRRVASTRSGERWLKSVFRLCPADVQSDLDINYFISWIEVIYSVLAMTDYPVATGFLKEKPPYPIGAFCSQIPSDVDTLSDRPLIEVIFRGLNVSYFNYTGTTECNSLNADDGTIAWSVQSCNEIMTPICTSDADMFEGSSPQFNMTEFVEQCEYYYNVTPNYSYMQTELLSKDIHSLSNVIFSNGLRDPWSSGGVLQSDNPDIDVIIIKDACHHEDLRGSDANDSPETASARVKEVAIIEIWIRERREGKKEKQPVINCEEKHVDKESTLSSTTEIPQEAGQEAQQKEELSSIV